MTLSRRTYLWGGLALLLAALAAGVYVFSGWLLNELLRPRLAALAADRLSAEVAIGRLAWEEGGLVVEDLLLDRFGHYRLSVPRLRLEASLAGVLRRRLAALEIFSPDLLLEPAPDAPAGGFPAQSPLDFGRIRVRHGRIGYRHPAGLFQAQQIDCDASGGGPYRFSLSTALGEQGTIPLRLTGRAEWQQGLSISLKTLQWDGRGLLDQPLAFSIPTDNRPAGGGRLHLTQLDRAAVQRVLEGLELAPVLPEGWDFDLRGIAVRFSLTAGRLQLGLQLAEGLLVHGALALPLSDLTLELNRAGAEWQGRGNGRLAGDNPAEVNFRSQAGELEGRLEWTVAEPGRVKELLAGGPPPALAGGVRLTAGFTGSATAPLLLVEAEGFAAGSQKGEHLLDLAPLRMQAKLFREEDNWRGRAQLFLSGQELAAAEGGAERLALQLRPVSWGRLEKMLGPRMRPAFLQDGAGLGGDLELSRTPAGSWAGTARLSARQLRLADTVFQQLSGRLRFDQFPDQAWAGSLEGEGRRIVSGRQALERITLGSRWRFQAGRLTFSGARAAARLVGPGQVSGELALAGSGFWQKERWQVRLASLGLSELEVLSEDGLAGLAGGELQAAGAVRGAPGRPLALDLQADLAASDALWGAYYADLSPWPARLTLRADFSPESRQLHIGQLNLEQAGIGTLQGEGTLRPGKLQLVGELALPNLAASPAKLLREVLGEGLPLFAEAEPGGALRITAAFDRQQEGWRLRGEARPVGLALKLPAARLSLVGLGGVLPFELTSGAGAPAGAGEEHPGMLQFQTAAFGPAVLAGNRLRIVADTDRWFFPDPLRLQAGGGRLTIDQLAVGRKEDGPYGDGIVTIAGIDLETLTGQLGLLPLEGRIDADLGRIRYAGGGLTSEGEALIDLFGGRLRVRNIRLDLSSLAYLQVFADLDFTAIDLFQLTRTFSFGVMNGIVDGYIRDLRLFGTTPARFNALLESREEGRRNISVKALNNLSILSQGGLSAALSRGIYRFIDFYRYRKIGIACELEKDVFYLRGTARSGSERYLVYGGVLPPKIDIIAPPSAVSFSEMLRRLKRIERTQ